MTAEKPFDSQIKRSSTYRHTGHVWCGDRKENKYWQKQWKCRMKMESKKYVTPGGWWDTFMSLVWKTASYRQQWWRETSENSRKRNWAWVQRRISRKMRWVNVLRGKRKSINSHFSALCSDWSPGLSLGKFYLSTEDL